MDVEKLLTCKSRADQEYEILIGTPRESLSMNDSTLDLLQMEVDYFQERIYTCYRMCLNELIRLYLDMNPDNKHNSKVEYFIHKMNRNYHDVNLKEECEAFLSWILETK